MADVVPAGQGVDPDTGRAWPVRKCRAHVTRAPCHVAPLPARRTLSGDQAAGRSRVNCSQQLTADARDRGTIVAFHGVHDCSVRVWSCPAPEGAA